MILELIRHEKIDAGTFGKIKLACAELLTLEPCDLNNEPDDSCIPEGVYHCVRVMSPKFGNTFMVQGVASRSNILLHAGNTKEDTHGCILLGLERGPGSILKSRDAVALFMQETAGVDQFDIAIRYQPT